MDQTLMQDRRGRAGGRGRPGLLVLAGALTLGAAACTGPGTPPRPTTTTTAPPRACNPVDFTEATVTPRPSTSSGPGYVLTVSGLLPDTRHAARLEPVVYVRQPEYWLIQVQACAVAAVGGPAYTPFKVSLDITGTLGTEGIEVAGVTKHERIDVPAKPAPPLAGTGWVLDPASLGAPAPGRPVTLTFDSTSRLSGSSGCNAFGAGYTAAGSPTGGTFALVEPIISTAMACVPDVSTTEATYLRKLRAADTYRIADSRLTLSGPEGALVYGTPPPAAS